MQGGSWGGKGVLFREISSVHRGFHKSIKPLSTHNIENHTVCRGNHTCRIFMRTTSSLAGLVPTNLA